MAKPEFDTNKQYLMTIESGTRVLAQTKFWLRGKGPKYTRQGRVLGRGSPAEVAPPLTRAATAIQARVAPCRWGLLWKRVVASGRCAGTQTWRRILKEDARGVQKQNLDSSFPGNAFAASDARVEMAKS